jgi:uncharacterized membrane protein YfcA
MSDSTDFIMIGPLPTFWFCLCSFIANAGVSVVGFGMALIFVTVYTVVDVAGGFEECRSVNDSMNMSLCGIKYAVFLQSLSLVGSMPILMAHADAFKNANRALLHTLIPVTLISTPLGQYCQALISASWIKVVVGGVVILVVLYKMGSSMIEHQQRRSRITTTPPNNSVVAATERTSLVETGSSDSAGGDNDGDGENKFHEFSPAAIRLWGVLLGGGSGFLGGLIGMRGPPLMIFFLAFPFPKAETRAVGSIMLFLNMVLRIAYYVLSDIVVNEDDNQPQWFYRSEWPLYIGVILAGAIGVPIGDWIHNRLDQSTFQNVLALLLAATGIVNIWKGTSELLQPPGDGGS